MKLRDDKILCGCTKGIMCIYDIKMNNILFLDNKVHEDAITDLLSINAHQFISCSWDNTIKVWEY